MAHEAQTRLPWTAEEDAILISLVERYGEKRWNMVANGLPGRTGKGCSHRWRTYLRPDVKHPHLEPFTEWEAAVIVQAQRDMGNNWLAIAKLLLPGRSNTAVKNFWHCRLKSGSGTNVNRFIVNQYPLHYLLNEVPHDERIHPVALPAFPSTAPTGQLHHHKHQEPALVHLPIPAMDANPTMANEAAAQGYGADLDAAAIAADMIAVAPGSSSIMAASTAAAAAAAQQAPQDPTLYHKEDMRRRASAYVQQQLVLMGQPVSRHTSGGGSSSQAGVLQHELVTHTATYSQVNNSGCMLPPHSSLSWSNGSGSYSMHMQLSASACVKKFGSSGRGRGRRPKARDSFDDPYDETYVPAGVSREEEIARCRNYAANNSAMVVSSSSGATVLGNNSIGTQSTLIPTSTTVEYSSVAVMDAAAAAAMPCMADASSCDAAAAVQYGSARAFQQQHSMLPQMTVIGRASGAAVAAAELEGTLGGKEPSVATAAGVRISAGGCGFSRHNVPATTDSDDGNAAAGATWYASQVCTAAAVAAPSEKFSGLEAAAAAVDFEGFRPSGVDFKMSLSSLDDLLSGGNATGSADDLNRLQSVAGLFRDNSLDGSRFSLTGSANGLGSTGRDSSRGFGLSSSQRASHQQLVHILHQQQQQQLEHMLMPPPKCPDTQHTTMAPSAAVPENSRITSHQQYGGGSITAPAGANAVAAAAGHCYHDICRCDSPFKAAAVQQAPFSAAVAANIKAATSGPGKAPSSQPTVCSANHFTEQLAVHSVLASQQEHQQNFTDHVALHCQQQHRLPATFESVLQAILPGSNQSKKPAEAGLPQHQKIQIQPAAAAFKSPGAEAVLEQQGSDVGRTAAPGFAQADIPAPQAATTAAEVASPLHVHCPTDADLQHQPPSMPLLSPVGKYLTRPSEDGCLLLDEAMRVCSYDLHTVQDDSAQTRAERRSLRMLLGALASSESLACDPSNNFGSAAATVAGHNGYRRGSSSRHSHSSQLSGGCGAGFSGRVSSRGVPNWYELGGPTTAAAGAFCGQSCEDRGAALVRRTSNSFWPPGESGKRQRMSLLIASPMGAASKRPRVSDMAARVPFTRPSTGAFDLDDCLSFWQN